MRLVTTLAFTQDSGASGCYGVTSPITKQDNSDCREEALGQRRPGLVRCRRQQHDRRDAIDPTPAKISAAPTPVSQRNRGDADTGDDRQEEVVEAG